MDYNHKFRTSSRFVESLSTKGKKMLLSNGYRYQSQIQTRVSKPYLYWRCSNHRRSKCRAMFYTDMEMNTYSRFQQFHSCTGSEDLDPIDFIDSKQINIIPQNDVISAIREDADNFLKENKRDSQHQEKIASGSLIKQQNFNNHQKNDSNKSKPLPIFEVEKNAASKNSKKGETHFAVAEDYNNDHIDGFDQNSQDFSSESEHLAATRKIAMDALMSQHNEQEPLDNVYINKKRQQQASVGKELDAQSQMKRKRESKYNLKHEKLLLKNQVAQFLRKGKLDDNQYYASIHPSFRDSKLNEDILDGLRLPQKTAFVLTQVQKLACRKCDSTFQSVVGHEAHVCKLPNTINKLFEIYQMEQIKDGSFSQEATRYNIIYLQLHKGTNSSVTTYSSDQLLFSWEYLKVGQDKLLRIHHLFTQQNVKKETVFEFLGKVVTFHNAKHITVSTNRNRAEEQQVSDQQTYHQIIEIMKGLTVYTERQPHILVEEPTESSQQLLHKSKHDEFCTERKRKPSTPTDVLRREIQDLKMELSLTRTQMDEIRTMNKKQTKSNQSSHSNSSTSTQQIIINLNVSYSPIFLNVHNELKIYLKQNAQHFMPTFEPSGLKNLGQTCYINSALQMFAHINQLLTHTRLFPQEISSKELYDKLIPVDRYYNTQQDVHEYLLLLHDNFKHLQTLLTHEVQSVILCSFCGHLTLPRSESHWSLQMSMDNSLQTSFNQFFAKQYLDGYQCDKCRHKQCYAQFKLRSANDLLILHLKRFLPDMKKDNSFVYCNPFIQHEGVAYELIGCINHIGHNLNSGHYIYCFKHQLKDDILWSVVDDDKIFSMQANDAFNLHQEGYIFLYKTTTSFVNPTTSNNGLGCAAPQTQRNNRWKVLKYSKGCKEFIQKVWVRRNALNNFELQSNTDSNTSDKQIKQRLQKSKTQLSKYHRKHQIQVLVKFLQSEIIIGDQITDFASIFDDNVKYYEQPTPLELIDSSKPFCDGFKIRCYKQLFPSWQDMELFLKQFLNVKQLKYSNTNKSNISDYYWVRLNDDDAFINEKLCRQFLMLLQQLKVRLINHYLSIGLHEEEIEKKIQQEIPITQIDDTFDVKGFVYLNDFEKNAKRIAQLIGYELNRYVKSTKTSLQFTKSNGSLLKQKRKLYNKTLQQIQSESVSKRITNGLKLVAFASHSSYQRICEAQQTGMSRSECCNMFSSYCELETFLKQPNISQNLTAAHQNILHMINSDVTILTSLNGNMSIDEAITVFFSNIKRTVIIFTEDVVCLIYGYNTQSRKYYGVLQNRPYGKNIEEFVKRYAVPFQDCAVYELNHKAKYKCTTFYKTSPILQLPFQSLCDRHIKKLNYIFFDNNTSLEFKLVYNVIPSEIEITLKSSTHNFSNKELKNRNKKLLCKISSRYSKHSAQFQELKELNDSIIHLITFNKKQSELILYDNTRNIKFKTPFSGHQFDYFAKELLAFNFVYSGIKLICINGMTGKDLNEFIKDSLQVNGTINKTQINQIKLKRQRKQQQQQQQLKSQVASSNQQALPEIQNDECSSFLNELNKNQNYLLPCIDKKQHLQVQFDGIQYRYKGQSVNYFLYECLKKGCKASLRVSLDYNPLELVKQHTLKTHK